MGALQPRGSGYPCTSRPVFALLRDCELCLTIAVLVYDIAVEAYCPWRVMRQFGQRQEFPVPSALEHVSRHDHM